ncbi:EAL domain-containing protein [Noviherbaspirillum sp. L7-7A]|uniref:bifunctional diguanylate cyclase/phosphodiesterase n=1 Tax=Noviherbaspirillum sp. L7-7A TaxID=2850560 RepID=UPI001C2C8ED8|nr:EAL domain-containing protein [Noviherbaspirillum sp. L7-7A]MBV0881606.1 EAL domain-containing protein [Noviherbaspirillum sp. L7-7A]
MTIAPQNISFGQQFGLLRSHAKSLAPWPLGCTVLVILLWLWVGATLHREKKEVRQRAVLSASTQAHTYSEQVDRNIGQLDYILQSLQFQWREDSGRLNLEKQFNPDLVPKVAKISITIFDRLGMPVTSTNPAINGKKSVASAEHFQAHIPPSSNGLLISEPLRSTLTGREVMILSRRLTASDGSFGGVIMVAIEPAFIASFVDESKLGDGDFVAIRRADGAFLATKTNHGLRSHSPNYIGTNDSASPSGVKFASADQYLDGKPRIVAWRVSGNYPIKAIVGLSEEALMAEYEPRTRELHLVGLIGTLFLMFLGVAGMRSSAIQAWRAQHAREIHEAYRLATENAREGFYMLRPLFGRNDEIVDFLIEDCNERGAMYRGLPREALIGKTMSATIPVISQTYMMAACKKAMQTGFFEDEIRVPERGSRPAQWLQKRIVRSSAGLALTLRDITEIKSHQDALMRMANADSVTTLPNRHWLMQHLPAAVDNARSMHKQLAVLFVDLDDFKNINDTLGHAIGDELLKAAALRLKAVIRPEDKVARLGGDEFTIIVEAAQTREEVVAVADRVIETLRTPFVLGDLERQHFIHASIGISLFPQDGPDGDTLLKCADIAMYVAKNSGKGTYRFFEPSQERRLVMRLNREAELKQAIARGELILHYQPRVQGDTGEITSMEALVRWVHPTLGLIPPNQFIPMAERTGLIVPLGAEVVRMVCEQLALWKTQDLQVVPVSVNVSAQQVDTDTISAMLATALKASCLDPRLLEVEVTESATLTKDGAAVTELAAIQKTGIKLYVDDFGTGYSCLAQLKRLDMDGLKIDRAFTAQMLNSPADAALFEAIVSMAHALEMRVVAEGVETDEQLAALQVLGCEEVQGYYISMPVPAAEAGLLLRKRFLFPAA